MRRILLIIVAIPIVIFGLMGLSFVGTQLYLGWKTYPDAAEVPNWTLLAQEQIPSVLTIDEDGDRRVTQVWIAALEGKPYLRTGDSKWFSNLQRDGNLDLRIGGSRYPCAVSVVTDSAKTQAVNAAFFAKYPKRSKMFQFLGVSTTNVLALDCQHSA